MKHYTSLCKSSSVVPTISGKHNNYSLFLNITIFLVSRCCMTMAYSGHRPVPHQTKDRTQMTAPHGQIGQSCY